jgi:2'-5' RNA ligase
VTGVAIVAIPSEEDYVWQISSEKVPHLTLLFLGDVSDIDELGRITSYLQHVTNTSLYQFGLEVDRRGLLGEKRADVVFFKQRDTRMMEEARAYLLQDPNIFRAYHSIEQYPSWTPHLTLGYPETPAKPLVTKDDWTRNISWVTFDRIALWTGDYEGTEFRLKERYYSEEVRMSELAHYGVKGMKWGIRRDPDGRIGINKPEMLNRAEKLSYKTNKTQSEYQQAINKAGGLHKMSSKRLEEMRKRLELEKKLRDVINEDAKRRSEKRMAALKILGEVGKIAVPLILGAAVNAKMNNSGPFRTNAYVSRNVIDVSRKAIGS